MQVLQLVNHSIDPLLNRLLLVNPDGGVGGVDCAHVCSH